MKRSYSLALLFIRKLPTPPLSLDKDAPETRAVQAAAAGRIMTVPQVGGLHHRYERRAA
jgi:hypothetical protein